MSGNRHNAEAARAAAGGCGGRTGGNSSRHGGRLAADASSSGPSTRPRGWAKVGAQARRRESADKPGSVESNHPSGTHVAVRLEQPTRKPLRAAGTSPKARALPYLALLQVGFAVPPRVATGAVRSYRTVSPLPAGCSPTYAVCSLLHCPWARAPQALPGTLLCGARTFLCVFRSGCLADSRRQYSAVDVRLQGSELGASASARS